MTRLDRTLRLQSRSSLSDSLAKAFHRLAAHLLAVDTSLGVTKVMETQKLEARFNRHDAVLLWMQQQTSLTFQEFLAGNESGFCFVLTFGEDNKVICIANQPIARLRNRFADDFVIFTKSEDEAEAALV